LSATGETKKSSFSSISEGKDIGEKTGTDRHFPW